MDSLIPAASPSAAAAPTSPPNKWYRVGDPDRDHATAGAATRFFLEHFEEDLGPDTDAILAMLDQYPSGAITGLCKRPEDALQYAWVQRPDKKYINVDHFGTPEEKQAALAEQVMEWPIEDPIVILDDGDDGYFVLDRRYPQFTALPPNLSL